MDEDAFEGGGKASGRVNKRQVIPKDPHAPKKPLSAYNTFAAVLRVKMKKKNPERSFGEMNREIGSQWNSMTPEEKQPYIDQSEADRDRYMKELEEYHKTDSYKKFTKTVMTFQKKDNQRKKEKDKKKKSRSPAPEDFAPDKSPLASVATNVGYSIPPSSRPLPLALKQSFVSDGNIPIFTEQFLQHNRELETQVRKLRQTTLDMEEENALLSRHVESMKVQIQKLQTEVDIQSRKNKALKEHLVFLQESLTDSFCDVPVPGTETLPTVDTIESYLKELEAVVTKEPGEHSNLVTIVTKVANDVEEKARARHVPFGGIGGGSDFRKRESEK